MFKCGERIVILEEFRDQGDEEFTWVAVGDEEKDSVDISPLDIDMEIKPLHTVQATWIRPAEPGKRSA